MLKNSHINEMLSSHFLFFLLQVLALLGALIIEKLKDHIIENWKRRHGRYAELNTDIKMLLYTLTIIQSIICGVLINDGVYIATGISPITIVKEYLNLL